MDEDDLLFVRCLIVAATLTGCVVSALSLVPGPNGGTADADASSLALHQAPRASVMFALPSRGPRAQLARALTAVAASTAPAPRPHARRAAHAEGPRPDAANTSLRPAPRTHAAAVTARLVVLGNDTVPPVRGRPPRERPSPLWLAPTHQTMPPLQAMPAEHITAVRPTSGAPELDPEEPPEDALPEFRRFLPRAMACATGVARRRGAAPVGKAVLSFTVMPSGWVRRARVVGGSLQDPDLADCMTRALTREHIFAGRPLPLDVERTVIFH